MKHCEMWPFLLSRHLFCQLHDNICKKIVNFAYTFAKISQYKCLLLKSHI